MKRESGRRLSPTISLLLEPDWSDPRQVLQTLATDPAHGIQLMPWGIMHITLKFLSTIPLEWVLDIIQIAGQMTSQSSPFQMMLRGLGWYRKATWVAVDEDVEAHPLTRLDGRLDLQLTVVRLATVFESPAE